MKAGKDHIGVGVGGILLRDGRILLLKRNSEPNKGKWEKPGGRVDFGETLEAAVVREMKEETGVDCKVVRLLAATSEISPGSHWVSISFLLEGKGEPKLLEPGKHGEMKWFALDGIPKGITESLKETLRVIALETKN